VRGLLYSSLAALGLLPAAASAQTLVGKATAVDGDSLSVGGMSIRLFGIDAPEGKQTCTRDGAEWACGEEAARQLSSLVQGQQVVCRGRGTDDYGRTIAVCQASGLELNRTMVQQGWAVAFRNYSSDYIADEERAKVAKAGIWSSTFVMPVEWEQHAHLSRPRRLSSTMRPRGPLKLVRAASSRETGTARANGSTTCPECPTTCRHAQKSGSAPRLRHRRLAIAGRLFASEAQPGEAPDDRSLGHRRSLCDGIPASHRWAVLVTRDQELWGVALWAEKTHGDRGPDHIAAQVARLAAEGDEEGIAMWRAVAERYDKLHERTSTTDKPLSYSEQNVNIRRLWIRKATPCSCSTLRHCSPSPRSSRPFRRWFGLSGASLDEGCERLRACPDCELWRDRISPFAGH
jgi:endonuclease YncB( thermonuclease family)